MLRIQRCILARLLSSSTASPVSPLQRLLSAAAPRISPNPSFDVAEYLVGNCGLTRVQALKASPKISHLKSPTNPDAVLAFLAGLGLSCADVAAIVAKDPKFLCAKVERTLAPNVADLAGVGLPHTEIALLVSRDPGKFRCRFIVSNLPYCVSLFGSYENVLRAIKHGSYLLHCDLEDTVKPNVALLQGCGLDACDIAKLGLSSPWLLTANMEQIRTMVACAEGIGVPRGSGMFRTALLAVAFQSKEKIATKVDYLKKMFRWSDAEVRIAVCKAPVMLAVSMDTLQRKSEFLISEMGLEPAYLAHRPSMINFSLEGRLRPGTRVFKFLKENGLLKGDPSYYTIVRASEKVFVGRFICPHKELRHTSVDTMQLLAEGKFQIYVNQEQALRIGQACMAQQTVESAE